MALYGAAAASIAVAFGVKYSTVNWQEVPNGFQGRQVTEMLEHLHGEAGPRSVVVFAKARWLALYANTRACDVYWADPSDEVVAFYRRIGVTHVVLTSLVDARSSDYLAQLIEAADVA